MDRSCLLRLATCAEHITFNSPSSKALLVSRDIIINSCQGTGHQVTPTERAQQLAAKLRRQIVHHNTTSSV